MNAPRTLTLIVALTIPATIIAQPPGQIVFVSDRDGQFSKIWLMNANGSQQTQLTFGDASENDPAWSPEGERIVYVSNPVPGSQATQIVVMNRRGGAQRIVTSKLGVYRHPEFSPDGSQILLSKQVAENETELYVVATAGGEPRHVPMPLSVAVGDLASFDQPTWAPDGLTVAFWVWRRSELGTPNFGNVYRAGLDGQNLRRLTDGIGSHRDPAWSPDGTRIAFYADRPEGEGIFLMDPDGGRLRLLSTSAVDWAPSWSPDGEWITFVSTRDGSQDVFIMRADGTEAVNLTVGVAPADRSPSWSSVVLPQIPTSMQATGWAEAKKPR